MRKIIGVMWLVAAVALSSCGGSGSGSSNGGLTNGVEIASQVSLVKPQDVVAASLAAPLPKGLKALLSKAVPTGGAYVEDPLNMWVYDGSMEALDMVNEILCQFDQTAYAQMIGEGDYIALIDFAKCNMKSADKSSTQGNQSAGSTTEELETWIVNSSIVDGVQIVKAWIETTEDMGPNGETADVVIHAKATITEGMSDENPFGVFRIDFQMFTETEAFMQGYLESLNNSNGMVELQMSMAGDMMGVQAVHVVMDADGNTGNAYAEQQFGNDEGGSYNVAFDENHYLASKGEGTEICLDRKNFNYIVYRYGVYNEDGSRLDLENPGFSVKYETDDEMFWGFADYYGIWLPKDIELVSGLTVNRATNDSSSGEEYTTIVAPGKLVKHTKGAAELGDFLNDVLYFWDEESQTNYMVEWDGSIFNIVGQEECDENGCQKLEAEGTIEISPGDWVNFWRDGFGGIFFVAPEEELTDNTEVQIDKTTIATAADVGDEAVTFYCYTGCLSPNLTTEQLNGDPFLLDKTEEQLEDPYVYIIDPLDMTLTHAGEPVVPAPDAESFDWGVQSGAMLTDTSELLSIWDGWGQDIYYTWETGTNNWNKFAGLIDSDGNQVVFDPPYKLNYTHVYDDGTSDKFMLDYAGFGELNGMPWEQVEGTDMWQPLLTIPDGSEVTADDVTYYVRALEGEQRMMELDLSDCGELEIEDLDAPDNDYVDTDIGSIPTVTDDPAVIKGELTGS